MTPVLVIFSDLTQDSCSGSIQCINAGPLFLQYLVCVDTGPLFWYYIQYVDTFLVIFSMLTQDLCYGSIQREPFSGNIQCIHTGPLF